MFARDLIVLVSLCLCTVQGDQSKECEDYENSKIPADCEELQIDNGHVCYNYTGFDTWKAYITCAGGFKLSGVPIRACRWRNEVSAWDRKNAKCLPETAEKPQRTNRTPHITRTTEISASSSALTPSQEGNKDALKTKGEGGSLLAVYVTVPLVVIVLLVGCGLLLWFLNRRRRREASHRDVPCNRTVTSTETNKTYGVPVDNTDCIPATSGEIAYSEYAEIQDCDNHTTGDNEYNTLQMNGRDYNSLDYNHITVQSETGAYDHSSNIVKNAKQDSGPYAYSHLNDDKSIPADPSYDHTGIRSDAQAVIELDTYARMNAGLDVDVVDETVSHEYFVLEKTE